MIVTRRVLGLYSAILGLTLAGLVALIVLVLSALGDKVTDNSTEIERLDSLTAQLRALTHPTPAQYREQVRVGIQRCLREPACRRLFPGLSHRPRRGATGRTSPTQGGGHPAVSGRATPTPRQPRRTYPAPTSPREPVQPRPGSGGAPPPQPPAPATPSITAPLPAQACTYIIRVNC